MNNAPSTITHLDPSLHRRLKVKLPLLAGTVCMAATCLATLAAEEGGVVAHWDFNERHGTIVRDVSGHGLDGRIHGARHVPHDHGHALEFDGRGAHVDFGSPSELNLRDAYTLELWIQFSPDMEGYGLQTVMGKTIGTYAIAFNPMTTMAWFFTPRPVQGGVPIEPGRWHHLVATYDQGEGRVYLDGNELWWTRGRLTGREGQIPSSLDVPFTIGGSPSNNHAEADAGSSFKGLISEALVYGRALEAGEVQERYLTTNLGDTPGLMAAHVPPTREIAVDVDLRPLGEIPPTSRLSVRLEQSGRTLAEQSNFAIQRSFESFEFNAADLAPGNYAVVAQTLDPEGRPIGRAARAAVTVEEPATRFPKETAYGTRLNNLVTEMIHVEEVPTQTESFFFEREREGWTFLSIDLDLGVEGKVELLVRSEDGKEETWLSISGDSTQEPWQGDGNTWEIMRRLPEGRHELLIRRQGIPQVGRLIVRAVPHLGWFDIHNHERNHPKEGERGPEYYAHRALRNFNFFIYGFRVLPDEVRPFIHRWQETGRQAFTSAILPHPGHRNWSDAQMTAEDIVRHWLENYSDPILDGIFIDELHGRPQFASVYEQTAQLFNQETGQEVYVFTGNTFRVPQHKPFLETAIETGGRIAWERYLPDERSLLLGWYRMRNLVHNMTGWRLVLPTLAPDVMVNMGTMSIPTASLHHWPEVDFKVYLDLMMHTIANDPEFYDTAGVVNFKARQNKQDLVDWISAMSRHYFIEGRLEMLSQTPYRLRHVDDPGFVHGLEHWQVEAAEPDAIRAETFRGFATLQGQAWPQQPDASGDQVIVMRRSDRGPNTIKQTLKDLTPGQVYAVSVVSADYTDMSEKVEHPLQIDIGVGEEHKLQSYTHLFTNLNHTSLEYPDRETAWMNYHRVVFRATDTEAVVAVSDRMDTRASSTTGPEELMIGFVEVKPYFEKPVDDARR